MTGGNLTLANSVEQALERYFEHLDGAKTCDLYSLVLAEVERPLLSSVMEHARRPESESCSRSVGLESGDIA